MTECIRRPGSVWTRCTCGPCRIVNARAAAMRDAGQPYRVPSEDGWDAMDELRGRGLGPIAIGHLIGSPSTYVAHCLRIGPTGHVWSNALAAALVEAAASRREPAEGRRSALGAMRRLQHLAVLGYGTTKIRAATIAAGYSISETAALDVRMGRQEYVFCRFHLAVAAAFDALDGTPNPGRERITVQRKAAARGWTAWDGPGIDWVPVTDWDEPDDEDTVDEAAVLRLMAGDLPADVREVDRDVAVMRMLAAGEPASRVGRFVRADLFAGVVPGGEADERAADSAKRFVERVKRTHDLLTEGLPPDKVAQRLGLGPLYPQRVARRLGLTITTEAAS
jgi:hypothetical protein